MKKTLAVLAVLVALPLVAIAQLPVTEAAAVSVTAKIEAIDQTGRLITLKGKGGETDTIYAGPEVKRFDELKVGDTVTFTYFESVAYDIHKPGTPATAPATGDPKVTRGTGPKPSGTVAQRMNATVTIKAIDASVPAVTVVTADGRTLHFKVENKKNLEGVKAGDKVEVTYTQAFMVSVK